MHSSGMTPGELASRAGVDERTIYSLLNGRRWPSKENRDRIEQALGWPVGELWRQAVNGHEALGCFTDRDLLHELVARARAGAHTQLPTFEALLDQARRRDPENRHSPRC